jgi:hypothetical protein
MQIDIEYVKKIKLGPEDKLLVKLSVQLSQKRLEQIHAQAQDFFPDNEIILLPPGIDLEAIGPEKNGD